ncbi:MAG: S41 family peptidase [Burkholderiales bacterium]|nr:S41 family peptidase [Phycisphaerae bacterium]
MKREQIAWLITGGALCAMALNVPGSMAQRDDDYRFVRTLVDIYRHVGTNYVESVEEKKLQQSAINGMLGSLDPHTMYVPPDKIEAFNDALDGSFRGVGIRLNQTPEGDIEVITPIDDSPAWKAGVRPGDVIIKVNGETIGGMRLEDVIPKIQGSPGTKVTLTMRRGKSEPLDLTMTRQEFVVPMIKGFSRNEDNTWNFWVDDETKIAYLRLTQFTPDTGDKISEIVGGLLKDGLKGLVFDLRFNPGGRLEEAERIIDLFVKDGTIVTVKGRNRPEQKMVAKADGTFPDFPMVVLVNEHSASASEVVAGSLKDNNRAIVVGSRTYGKGSVQEVVPLDANAGELKITVAYWYLPSGKLVQRLKDAKEWGVEPNVVITMNEDQQQAIAEAQLRAEYMHVTATIPTSMPATTQSTTQATTVPTTMPATTQATDTQLEKAIEVIREKVAGKN